MAQPNTAYPQNDPRYHTANIEGLLDELTQHLRQDIDKIDEPKAQVLFETTAEVLQGLRTAFEHYDSHSEKAMR